MEGLDLARPFMLRGGQARQAFTYFLPHQVGTGQKSNCCYGKDKKYKRNVLSREQPKQPPRDAAGKDQADGESRYFPLVRDMARSCLYKLRTLPGFKNIEPSGIVRKRNTPSAGVLRIGFSLTRLRKQLVSDLFGLSGGHECGHWNMCVSCKVYRSPSTAGQRARSGLWNVRSTEALGATEGTSDRRLAKEKGDAAICMTRVCSTRGHEGKRGRGL